MTNKPNTINKLGSIKNCCCLSYERGITPCLCSCHLGVKEYDRGYDEAMKYALTIEKQWKDNLLKDNPTP